ncbi:MAG: aldehyde dehydrogenase family protein [Candidatus Methylarchaceae archaeon HK02M2]|nr:aldehyde dehydrogenase family protein [Candidatus Methylarchaceae archaeon HK02M2]
MTFEHENTWFKALNSGKVEDFHRKYEEALKKIKNEFGKRYPHIIDGKEVFSEGEFPDTSPSDIKLVLGYFQKGTREDARNAIMAAKKAFPLWSSMPYYDRVKIFKKVGDISSERKFELAALMSIENGKNRFEAMADIDEGIDYMRFYSEEMEINKGYDNQMNKAFPNEQSKSVMKPYGVWGVISPFNFPFAIALGMSSGALITGNTAVFKPSSDTPLLGFKICEILHEAGLPNGVFNYVSGAGEVVGAELVENLDVSGIVFTGSKDVGFSSYRSFNDKYPRPFIAEMGGKNPTIVTSKANLEKAVKGVMKSAFGYCGQKCSACSRVYVDKRVKNDFIEMLVKRTKEEIVIADPTLKEAFMGPVINKKAFINYQRYIEIAKKDGKILTGGKVLNEGNQKDGYFVEPTVIVDLPKNHQFFKNELFVPILCIAEVDSLDEAIKLSNDVEYGLTAGIFTEDESEIQKFFDNIQAGVIYANRDMGATTGSMAGAQPFVGWKFSGSSGKGAGGFYYLHQFLREQSQTIVL